MCCIKRQNDVALLDGPCYNITINRVRFFMKLELKNKAVGMREKGYSLSEIAAALNISKSTASLWLRNIFLNKSAQERINKRKEKGRSFMMQRRQELKKQLIQNLLDKNKKTVDNFGRQKEEMKAMCSLLYWCEGNKNSNTLQFTNSDPLMVTAFLYLLRKSFNIEERKFRVCLHLHDYHDENKQKKFWSKLMEIPETQFIKSYRKPHTGKNKRKGYPGCVSLRYHDYKIANELEIIYKLFAEKYGRVV